MFFFSLLPRLLGRSHQNPPPSDQFREMSQHVLPSWYALCVVEWGSADYHSLTLTCLQPDSTQMLWVLGAVTIAILNVGLCRQNIIMGEHYKHIAYSVLLCKLKLHV